MPLRRHHRAARPALRGVRARAVGRGRCRVRPCRVLVCPAAARACSRAAAVRLLVLVLVFVVVVVALGLAAPQWERDRAGHAVAQALDPARTLAVLELLRVLGVLLGPCARDGAGLAAEVLGLASGQVVPDRGHHVDPRVDRRLEGARPDLVPPVVRVEQVAVAVEEGPAQPDALRDDVQRGHRQPELARDAVHDLVGDRDLALPVRHEHARQLGDDRVRRHGPVDRADVPLELVRVEVGDVVRADRHRADVGCVVAELRELVLLRAPRRRPRDAEVHHADRHARPLADAPCRSPT